MTVITPELPPLAMGDNLSLDDFLSRWEAMPELKRAELIRGVVYMPSPVSVENDPNQLFCAKNVPIRHKSASLGAD